MNSMDFILYSVIGKAGVISGGKRSVNLIKCSSGFNFLLSKDYVLALAAIYMHIGEMQVVMRSMWVCPAY